MSFTINKLIDKYGTSVKIKHRTETLDTDGRVTVTYPTTIETKCILYPTTGMREEWYVIGVDYPVDYVASFKSTVPVSVGDVVLNGSEELEVKEKVNRSLGRESYYIEVLLRRVT